MNKKILIIDDDPVIGNTLACRFSEEGFDILSALDGEDGVATALRDHPDIVLLDHHWERHTRDGSIT